MPDQNPTITPPEISDTERQAYLSKLHYLLSRTKSAESTICPSQIPRSLHDSNPLLYPEWRELMDPVRFIVWEEAKAGRVEVTQKGEIRNYEDRYNLKGPIRVRKGRNWDESLVNKGST